MFLKSCKPSLFSAVSFDAGAISFLALVRAVPVSSVFGLGTSWAVSCAGFCASALGVLHEIRPKIKKRPKEDLRRTFCIFLIGTERGYTQGASAREGPM